MKRIIKILIILLGIMASSANYYSQTPGIIFEGTDPNNVLDPNNDGYVSLPPSQTPSQFTSVGFPPNILPTDVNDILYSEIPYSAIPQASTEPLGDNQKGSGCGFIDLVDDANSKSSYYYNDGTNMIFRFRLGGAASNSKGYSVLIDTDAKFGFSGPNADPNAVVGNPGFEVEIVLRTNFAIDAYNIDGSNMSSPLIVSRPYATNAIKSLALTMVCDDPDYFYDFYLPFSDLTGFIDASTPIRMATMTSISPGSVIGSSSLTDISGIDDATATNDDLFTELIELQTPTNGVPIARADCPQITGGNINPGSILNGDTQVAGTSTEEDGTIIEVFVNDVSVGTTTVSGGNWTKTGLSLATDDVITASATVPDTVASGVEKGTSVANCDTTIVLLTDCTKLATPSFSSYTNGGRTLNLTYAAGTPSGSSFLFNFYDASTGTQITTIDGVNVVDRPSTSALQVALTSGRKFTDESLNFVVTVDTNPKTCESLSSEPMSTCTSGAVSVTPFLDPIAVGDTTISGNFGGSPPTSATLRLIINGASTTFIYTTTGSANTFSFDISGTTLSTSDAIKVSNRDFGTACRSTESSVVNPTTQSLQPLVTIDGCFNGNATSISGTSSEIGATITLYSKAGTGVTTSDTLEGTATVQSNGSWTVTGLSIAAGNYVAATAQNTGETVSNISNEVLISSKTTFTTLAISSDPITEGDASITGTSSGLPTGSTIQLYLDGDKAVNSSGNDLTTTTDGSGNWTFTGLDAPLEILYTGAVVTVSATSTVAGSCESDQSGSKVVICNPPTAPTISAVSSSPICENSNFIVSINNAQPGLAYELLDQENNVVGPTLIGPNPAANINIETDPIASGVTGLKVRVFKILATCTSVESNEIAISVNPAPTITLGENPSAVFNASAQTVDLTYSATTNSPSEYKIDFDDAAFTDVAYTALPASPIQITVPAGLAVGIYTATLTIKETTNGCENSYPFTITITDASTPTITLTNTSVDLCSGTTTANFAYSATTNTPNQYSINFTDAANLQGFVDISNTTLSATPIAVTVPTVAAGGTYTGVLSVANSTTSRTSIEYTITINIEKTSGGTIGSGQTILSGNDVAAFTSITDATGVGGVTYQWQRSTTSATSGFVDIGGATSATFDEGTITQTTYYKRIATSVTNSCTAESNVITVNVLSLGGVPMITQIYQVGNERWIEITNISGGTISANDIKVQLYKDKNTVLSGQTPDATYTVTSALNLGQSVLIKNSLSTTVTNISGSPLIDDNLTQLEGGNDFITLSVTTDNTSWDNRYDVVTNIPNNSSFVRIDEVSDTNKTYTDSEWVVFVNDALDPYRVLASGGPERHPHAPLISEITGSNTDANTLLGLHRVGSTTRTGSAWNNGFPDRSRFVIIDEDYNHSGSILSARKLTVNASNKLGITDNLLVVTNDVVLNGDIRLISSSNNSNSQLVQTHTSASLVTGSGSLLVDQNSTIPSLYRYNYMGSPVKNSAGASTFTVADVLKDGTNATSFAGTIDNTGSGIARDITFLTGNNYDGDYTTTPITLADYWIYTYAADEGTRASWTQKRSSGTIPNTDGFIFKGPGVAQNYTFMGIPKDGTLITSVGADESYLVANPYASSISVKKFIEDNSSSIDGTLYFWEHAGEQNGTGINGHFFGGYIGGYATRTISMGVTALAAAGGGGAFDENIEAESSTHTGVVKSILDNDIGSNIDIVELDSATDSIVFRATRSVDSLRIRYKSSVAKTLELKVNNIIKDTINLVDTGIVLEITGTKICIVSGDKVTLKSLDTNIAQIDYLKLKDQDGETDCGPNVTGVDGFTYTEPAAYIPIGQGFFVSGDSDGGTITFNNSQREYKLEGSDAVFFKSSSKSKQGSSSNLSVIKLGMDFTNNNDSKTYHRQIGISFSPYQTFAFDKGYDAEMFDIGTTDFYWKFPNNDSKYVIAGVQSIDTDLEIPLEITMGYSGEITIKIDEIKYVNHSIYITDKITGNSQEITNDKAIFQLEQGVYKDRFVLAFQPANTLAANNEIANAFTNIYVDNNNDVIHVTKDKEMDIKTFELYNILGANLQNWKPKNKDKITLKINRELPVGVYILKFNTNKGEVSKKIVLE